MKNRNAFERWAALMFGIFIIWILASVIAPIANTYLPGIDRLVSVTETNNIDPSEFWYLDVEVTDKAVFYIAESDSSSFSRYGQ
ncbi:MAG: hypothetical protein D3905_11065 [Candidatus Electrothrix sp. AS4_5]|nr:hypothetical protein [Candidatus Electrothrix sp. AX1]MCI5127486.1 hypothetical protein [Candidatus Electrothrix gigas]MCI5183533.1 hypothetical protein [Candidatus Electrothrix gigas]MCI5190308.1 hypothetical protein [Candidatus Electrothrix gigas]